MTKRVQYLDDLLDLEVLPLGAPAPVRDIRLLGSAVARPQTTAFGEDAYPNFWLKAAALLSSIVNNYALIKIGFRSLSGHARRVRVRLPTFGAGLVGVAISTPPAIRSARECDRTARS